jgi:hypothetical protein
MAIRPDRVLNKGMIQIESINYEGSPIHVFQIKNPPDRNPEGTSKQSAYWG